MGHDPSILAAFVVPPRRSAAAPLHHAARSRLRAGFTIMELMVAVSILVIIILSIGVTFSSASKSVGVSQATMDLMANVRATQELIARDLAGVDKSGFLVIRCRAADTSSNERIENGLRMDQLCFMAHGDFPDRTGTTIVNAPFTSSVSANSGLVWWGGLVMEKQLGSTDLSQSSPDKSFLAPDQKRLAASPLDRSTWRSVLPTGTYYFNGRPTPITNTDGTLLDSDFYLGRHVFLLLPPPANPIPIVGYASPALTSPTISRLDGPADVASSRYDVVAQSPSQLMADLVREDSGQTLDNWAEALLMTYRFRALTSVYDSEMQTLVNGYFRSTPIVMQGVSSFKVEWTDGHAWSQLDINNGRADASMLDQLSWYGPTHATNGSDFERNYSPNGHPVTGDQYLVIFNQSNRSYWPKALRITMHVGTARLQGGRDFVQVINLPQ